MIVLAWAKKPIRPRCFGPCEYNHQREEIPAIDASAQTVLHLTDQLAAMSNQHQEAQAAAVSNAERTRPAEWDPGQLRGQIGLVQ